MDVKMNDMVDSGLGESQAAISSEDEMTRDWRELFSDDSGQATVETLLLLGAVVLPFAVGAYFWVDITRHLFSRNAKYLALPFP